ncbi:homoserine O-acetyltransferase MetX [Sphingomonas sanguinis]|jgi:homoserine O-acetyltransferase|uniref:Homoserine O-acetyltransferase n=1 Tax=Sphingomonas sanguinis TaxID=33051 RepID=A0A147I0T1_9SPHN|nr:homoserine O-acetyltransferase [Sphingomonas sanguinis]KTT70994.1 homoserine acetyltransferase [Sphingomonas sanguinis]MBZ6381657.1 homoserine O-acetyltransferase [Sphingomonas sanguinis]NNG48263.1 homoserine O-acetyltransferase [Sphingomonas sanguinis]NNG53883.1 homoserine O-acetyltransferase [Sphingomonas sanguinis]NVP30958.1 homoserine O-acetyltransferase [Sphingomonas sanguinis]
MAASVSTHSLGDDQRFGLSRHVVLPGPLRLDGGGLLSPVEIGYETYGTLNADGSNAILICHALTGDQHVASPHPRTGKPGWWTRLVGEGKPIDPARHFIICSNVIGSCMGSSGPATIDPSTAEPWGMRFPVITIRDMVRAQAMLLDHLGVGQLKAVVGGSMGGMQALSWAATFPERVRACVMVASTARHSAQNIAFHEVGRQAIMADPKWNGGAYYEANDPPAAGLAVARMAAHITYLSEAGLTEKFGRRLQARPDRPDGAKSFGFDADFQVESYLRHQGLSFVDRFDANSYLYITRALDYFDLAEEHGGLLANAFRGTKTRFCLVSFDTDWLYPTSESRAVVQALNAAGAAASFVELSSPYGHDAFLLDAPEMNRVIDGFLRAEP